MFCQVFFVFCFKKNFCCKNLKFSKKENQEKSCGLMNKERQKQTRALFHLFPCYRFFSNLYLCSYCRYFCPVLDPSLANISILYPLKTPKNRMLSHAHRAHKLGTPSAKWDHHWLTHIWPIPPYHAPWKHQKTKGPLAFPGGHKTRRSARKGSSDKIKTIEDLLQAKNKNKIKWNEIK